MSSRPLSPFSESLFRSACGHFATGVAIATTVDALGNPHGLTVNSFTSVSLDPPLVLICIDYRAAVLKFFAAASHYGISILNDSQQEISNRFALRPDCRFEGTAWSEGITGVPLIDGSVATMECKITRIIEGGDHSILLAEAVAASIHGGSPLLYLNSGYAKSPSPR